MNIEKENKKKIGIFIIIVVVLILITIVLSLILKDNKKADKTLAASDYIIERETSYSDIHGNIPIINLKGEEIDKINNEIISKYYSVAYNQNNYYDAEYYIYKDVLSLFITLTYEDNSEYGTIEYYSYNINLDDNKVLSNNELYKYLGLNKDDMNQVIDNKLNSYYSNDSLNQELSFEQYKDTINYKEENNKLVIRDDKTLYCYTSLGLTYDLISYQGNKNEIIMTELK